MIPRRKEKNHSHVPLLYLIIWKFCICESTSQHICDHCITKLRSETCCVLCDPSAPITTPPTHSNTGAPWYFSYFTITIINTTPSANFHLSSCLCYCWRQITILFPDKHHGQVEKDNHTFSWQAHYKIKFKKLSSESWLKPCKIHSVIMETDHHTFLDKHNAKASIKKSLG